MGQDRMQKNTKDIIYHEMIRKLTRRSAVISHILGIETSSTSGETINPELVEFLENMNDGLSFNFQNLINAIHELDNLTGSDDIFIPASEQELVNNATTLGVIDMYEKYHVKSISCPNLVSCDLIYIWQTLGNYLNSGYPKLEEFNISTIKHATNIKIGYCPLLNLDFSSLENVENELIIYANILLETIDISNLESCVKLQSYTNPLLTEITISNLINCLNVDFSGNALTQTCVDDILNKIDIAGYENGTLKLNTGTNSIPSAVGLVSKSNLEGKGWTVSVNS